jgi:hypothetical protein
MLPVAFQRCTRITMTLARTFGVSRGTCTSPAMVVPRGRGPRGRGPRGERLVRATRTSEEHHFRSGSVPELRALGDGLSRMTAPFVFDGAMNGPEGASRHASADGDPGSRWRVYPTTGLSSPARRTRRWSQDRHIDWHYIAPGTTSERLRRILHRTHECLNETLFFLACPRARSADRMKGRLQTQSGHIVRSAVCTHHVAKRSVPVRDGSLRTPPLRIVSFMVGRPAAGAELKCNRNSPIAG